MVNLISLHIYVKSQFREAKRLFMEERIYFCNKGMKGIISHNRHNSSFEKDREKAKADALAYGVKVAPEKRNATSHR